jgi:hypothetical protein
MTLSEIIRFYDNNPNITLQQLSVMTGHSVAFLKNLLLKGEI